MPPSVSIIRRLPPEILKITSAAAGVGNQLGTTRESQANLNLTETRWDGITFIVVSSVLNPTWKTRTLMSLVIKRHMKGRQAFNTNSPTIKTLPEPPSSVLRLQKRCNRAAYDSAINQCRTTALLWGCSNLRHHQTYRLGLTTTISPKELLVLLLPLLALSKQASLWYQLLTLQVPRQQHGGTHNDCRYLRKGKISITVRFQVQFQHQNKLQTASSHKKHMGLTAARHQKSIWNIH